MMRHICQALYRRGSLSVGNNMEVDVFAHLMCPARDRCQGVVVPEEVSNHDALHSSGTSWTIKERKPVYVHPMLDNFYGSLIAKVFAERIYLAVGHENNRIEAIQLAVFERNVPKIRWQVYRHHFADFAPRG